MTKLLVWLVSCIDITNGADPETQGRLFFIVWRVYYLSHQTFCLTNKRVKMVRNFHLFTNNITCFCLFSAEMTLNYQYYLNCY